MQAENIGYVKLNETKSHRTRICPTYSSMTFLDAKIQPFLKLAKCFLIIMEIQDFSKHLEGIEASIKRQLERDLPKKLGNLAVRMFKENFQNESFFGRAWQEVKRRLHGAKGAAGQRKILTGPTGNLGRSIQSTPRAENIGYVKLNETRHQKRGKQTDTGYLKGGVSGSFPPPNLIAIKATTKNISIPTIAS